LGLQVHISPFLFCPPFISNHPPPTGGKNRFDQFLDPPNQKHSFCPPPHISIGFFLTPYGHLPHFISFFPLLSCQNPQGIWGDLDGLFPPPPHFYRHWWALRRAGPQKGFQGFFFLGLSLGHPGVFLCHPRVLFFFSFPTTNTHHRGVTLFPPPLRDAGAPPN